MDDNSGLPDKAHSRALIWIWARSSYWEGSGFVHDGLVLGLHGQQTCIHRCSCLKLDETVLGKWS